MSDHLKSTFTTTISAFVPTLIFGPNKPTPEVTYVKLNDTIEKETDVETVLAAKGYSDAIVTISDEAVDVSLNVESLSDTERAQIEDIVIRKTGYDISSVAISVMGGK